MTSKADPVRISIVIPCYNRAALIGDAIQSAIDHGEGAEIIVVDDGSTDRSWDRIGAFGERVRAFRIANGGVSAARNFGMARAHGTHIKFLDSDDRLPPRAIAALVEAQRQVAPHRIVFGDACSIGIDGEAIEQVGYGYADAAPPGALTRATLLSRVMSPLLPLYPIDALRRIGGFDPAYSLGEDQELAVRLALAGYEFCRVPAIVAEVREHPGERLSRGTAALYDRHVILFSGIVALFERAASPLTPDEALALAAMIWPVARDAARTRCRAQAGRLFAIATELVGPTAAAPAPLRPLYRWGDPYRVEQVIELGKRVAGAIRKRGG
jgi:hypothetical protein